MTTGQVPSRKMALGHVSSDQTGPREMSSGQIRLVQVTTTQMNRARARPKDKRKPGHIITDQMEY